MKNALTYSFEGQSIGEEVANSITHGVGAVLSLAATTVLVVSSALDGSALKIVSFSIFGFTLFLLYTISTLYHSIQKSNVKRFFHICDHSAIFVLIAGTYTPVTLIAIKGGWGWSLFGVAWGLALIGVLATLLFFEKARYFNVALYIAMGWLIVLVLPSILKQFSIEALIWLFVGGVGYTAGVLFYRAKRVRFHHMVWHFFVLGGSICHFFLMLNL